ncbi:unnamed protein product [Clonostachys chloroleuca]|uniref:Uncharacterized protein n=1 Tax=Clonostachys chloroleuca TaxID=1926264 RepID=A0AA35Q054_9HYPO|nr:unnamed protein product [Clonostachys chloroleuca]
MVCIKSILTLGLAAGATAVALPKNDTLPGCGEVNVFYTGLPPYHKYVLEQGYPGDVAAEPSRTAPCFVAGPEQPMSVTEDRMRWRHSHITGVGYGIRGSTNGEDITKFEDNLMLFRRQGPNSPTVFNYNPCTFLWTVQRRAPLSSDCAGQPGTDCGYEEVCGKGWCSNPTI